MVPGVLMISIGLVAGLLLVWLVINLARRRMIVAAPNARSSHTVPTPTMGGLAIVLVMLGFLFHVSVSLVGITPAANLLAPATQVDLTWCWLIALLSLTAVGLWDDLRELSAWMRLLVQVAAAALVLWSLHLPLANWVWILVLVALVWFINLYNFMDGIDGIAGAQLVIFGLGAQLLSGGVPGWSGDLLWLLTGASLGFLAFNWPPAKIFMGDAGSQPLGLLLGSLVLYLWQQGFLPLVGSLILLAGFWFDATYTLCVRMITGQAYTQAHRSHLYQRLAQRRGHRWTTMAYLAFSAFWLLPLAYFAVTRNGYGGSATVSIFGEQPDAWWWLLAAVVPLAVLCGFFRAGVPGRHSAS